MTVKDAQKQLAAYQADMVVYLVIYDAQGTTYLQPVSEDDLFLGQDDDGEYYVGIDATPPVSWEVEDDIPTS